MLFTSGLCHCRHLIYHFAVSFCPLMLSLNSNILTSFCYCNVLIETGHRKCNNVSTPADAKPAQNTEQSVSGCIRNADSSGSANANGSEANCASDNATRGLGNDANQSRQGGRNGACLLLLVCRGARPPHLVEHLYAMAARHGAPCLTLPMPSSALGRALGLKTCMAIAVKAPSSTAIAAELEVESTTPSETELGVKSAERDAATSRLMKRFVSDVLALPQNGL